MIKLAIIGAGNRGSDIYAKLANQLGEFSIVAVAEPNEEKRQKFATEYKIITNNVFADWQDLLKQDKLADAVIIATNDDMHYQPTKQAMAQGYHVLLEKPMSNNVTEIIKIAELDKQYPEQTLMVCHVLRYTPFFKKMRQLIQDKEIGDLVTISHHENIGYHHFSHSFVRGNWRNSDQTSPLILAKSCHDMDLLLFLTGSDCLDVCGYGNLMHFKPENAPDGAAKNCLDCPENVKSKCDFNAEKLYLDNLERWPTITITKNQTKEHVYKALRDTGYGRCVYHCDNNVVDHMSSTLNFANGVTATFCLSAFTSEISRTIRVMGTRGELYGNMEENLLTIKLFNENQLRQPKQTKVIDVETAESGHGGGDSEIIKSFAQSIKGNSDNNGTSATISLQSHLMAFALEHARVNKVSVNIEQFKQQIK